MVRRYGTRHIKAIAYRNSQIIQLRDTRTNKELAARFNCSVSTIVNVLSAAYKRMAIIKETLDKARRDRGLSVDKMTLVLQKAPCECSLCKGQKGIRIAVYKAKKDFPNLYCPHRVPAKEAGVLRHVLSTSKMGISVRGAVGVPVMSVMRPITPPCSNHLDPQSPSL